MSMTESEAIKVLEKPSKHIRMVHKTKNEMEFYTYSADLVEAFEKAISALEEIQQYRAIIGLTPEDLKALEKDEIQTIGDALKVFAEWSRYKDIGTVSEFREAMFFKKYFMELYGEGLEVANWHKNGDLESLDNFIDEAVECSKEEERGENDG